MGEMLEYEIEFHPENWDAWRVYQPRRRRKTGNKTITARMSKDMYAKYMRLGGAKWLKATVAAADDCDYAVGSTVSTALDRT